ncbi:MAG: EamA family transporter [Bryobacterales bacterium]|nr:EamA family transporter [Bryobacterales bacterium]
MTEGYLYALLGLLSFGGLGIFHKLADTCKCRPAQVNALLYCWSLAFVAIALLVQNRGWHVPSSVPILALPFGICASIAILAFQAGIRYGDIATSWLAINLSSGLPTLASILIYHEPVGWRRGLALCLIPVSMTLLWKDKAEAERRRG